MPIQFTGLDNFSEEESSTLRELIGHHFKKIKHKDISKFNLMIHAKKQAKSEKNNAASKYSINARMMAPTHLFSAESTEFDLRKASHEVMSKLESEFNHKFHTDTSYKKTYARR